MSKKGWITSAPAPAGPCGPCAPCAPAVPEITNTSTFAFASGAPSNVNVVELTLYSLFL